MVLYTVVNVHGTEYNVPLLMAAGRQAVGNYLLGIDVGTGGTRALIIDDIGRVVASATADHRPFASPKIGWAEQDPDDWWRACCVAVRKALAEAKLRGDEIACVGLLRPDAWSGDARWARERRTPGPDLVRRADGKQCRDLTAQIGADELIQLTCNPALTNFTLTKFLVGARKRAGKLAARSIA